MEETTNNIQKGTVILSVAVIALAGFSFWQQQEINQLINKQTVSVSSGTNSVQTGVAQEQSFNQAQLIRVNLLASKIISGIVVSANSTDVVITAALVDLSALDTFDFTKSQPLPTLNKNLTVKITKDTTVSGSTFVAGGLVTIQTKEPVYGGGVLTAISVNMSAPQKSTVTLPVK